MVQGISGLSAYIRSMGIGDSTGRRLLCFAVLPPRPSPIHRQDRLTGGGGFWVSGLGFRVQGLGFRRIITWGVKRLGCIALKPEPRLAGSSATSLSRMLRNVCGGSGG